MRQSNQDTVKTEEKILRQDYEGEGQAERTWGNNERN